MPNNPAGIYFQTLAKWGPNLSFVFEPNFKFLVPKLNQNLKVDIQIRVNMKAEPGSKLLNCCFVRRAKIHAELHFITQVYFLIDLTNIFTF